MCYSNRVINEHQVVILGSQCPVPALNFIEIMLEDKKYQKVQIQL